MPEYQNTYTASPLAAYAGMPLDYEFENVFSKKIETAIVAFGLAVGDGTADDSAKLAGAGFAGVTIADKAQTTGDYPVGSVAGVINKGTVWVVAATAVTPASVVTFTVATGAIGDAAVGAGIVAIAGAKFLDTAAIGGLTRLFLG